MTKDSNFHFRNEEMRLRSFKGIRFLETTFEDWNKSSEDSGRARVWVKVAWHRPAHWPWPSSSVKYCRGHWQLPLLLCEEKSFLRVNLQLPVKKKNSKELLHKLSIFCKRATLPMRNARWDFIPAHVSQLEIKYLLSLSHPTHLDGQWTAPLTWHRHRMQLVGSPGEVLQHCPKENLKQHSQQGVLTATWEVAWVLLLWLNSKTHFITLSSFPLFLTWPTGGQAVRQDSVSKSQWNFPFLEVLFRFLFPDSKQRDGFLSAETHSTIIHVHTNTVCCPTGVPGNMPAVTERFSNCPEQWP